MNALLSLSPALALLSGSDWPQFNGPDHDRTSPQQLSETDWSSSPPREVWRIDTRTGFSSFCVADGKAFTLERRRVDAGDVESCIAYDATNGEELWTAALCQAQYDGGGERGAQGNEGGDGPRSTPAYADGRVFVLDSTFALTAFEAGSGEVAWFADIASEHEGRELRWGNAASPVLAAGRVLVAGGGPGQSFLAFEQDTGEVAWKTGDEAPTHATPTIATLHGVEQAIFLTQQGLHAVAVDDGRTVWRVDYPYRTSSAASPVVLGDMVYVSAGYGVGAGVFRIARGADGAQAPELLWQKRNQLMNHWSTPVAAHGKVYGLFGFKAYGDASLACVDMATGELHWEREGFGQGGLIRVGDELLVLGDAGQLVRVALDPQGYRELGRIEALEGKCWSSPAFADGRAYVRSTAEGTCYELVTQ